MRIACAILVALLALNSVFASHWACYRRRDTSFGWNIDAVLADPNGIIIAQTGFHNEDADVYTKKNSRGRMDINRDFQHWSCATDGVDHGGFVANEVKTLGNRIDKIAFGCYDLGGTDYCKQYDYIKNMCYGWLNQVKDGKLKV
ncbi:hypothetical protein BCR41DRAFT_365667 [Lobosporangium transversale]|uniref:Uncharacterized protein n=1 Tax=Lobosporangium transversale TaxID=64571 RepID=A0A1Y2G685_9FUNG|nr:hypothetical protein BCR41DRAFT_365661 [Lobosporangium transversale]XP_021875167.1 hypothetical protein BCR41DRAFT_365667 [Lobosporangium transversale]ORY93670.1 hypothetical protein BCR41DRAFT_365661 [Lobosporangium transversale]ORY93672.1 hypothetical protein BCR41DRAFT_365667 [Lobosporangium transversale]|eukprot:XP_021875165.1 hypothetical protein BCR41DRAFT_365661 [Lobosporangium transversale]